MKYFNLLIFLLTFSNVSSQFFRGNFRPPTPFFNGPWGPRTPQFRQPNFQRFRPQFPQSPRQTFNQPQIETSFGRRQDGRQSQMSGNVRQNEPQFIDNPNRRQGTPLAGQRRQQFNTRLRANDVSSSSGGDVRNGHIHEVPVQDLGGIARHHGFSRSRIRTESELVSTLRQALRQHSSGNEPPKTITIRITRNRQVPVPDLIANHGQSVQGPPSNQPAYVRLGRYRQREATVQMNDRLLSQAHELGRLNIVGPGDIVERHDVLAPTDAQSLQRQRQPSRLNARRTEARPAVRRFPITTRVRQTSNQPTLQTAQRFQNNVNHAINYRARPNINRARPNVQRSFRVNQVSTSPRGPQTVNEPIFSSQRPAASRQSFQTPVTVQGVSRPTPSITRTPVINHAVVSSRTRTTESERPVASRSRDQSDGSRKQQMQPVFTYQGARCSTNYDLMCAATGQSATVSDSRKCASDCRRGACPTNVCYCICSLSKPVNVPTRLGQETRNSVPNAISASSVTNSNFRNSNTVNKKPAPQQQKFSTPVTRPQPQYTRVPNTMTLNSNTKAKTTQLRTYTPQAATVLQGQKRVTTRVSVYPDLTGEGLICPVQYTLSCVAAGPLPTNSMTAAKCISDCSMGPCNPRLCECTCVYIPPPTTTTPPTPPPPPPAQPPIPPPQPTINTPVASVANAVHGLVGEHAAIVDASNTAARQVPSSDQGHAGSNVHHALVQTSQSVSIPARPPANPVHATGHHVGSISNPGHVDRTIQDTLAPRGDVSRTVNIPFPPPAHSVHVEGHHVGVQASSGTINEATRHVGSISNPRHDFRTTHHTLDPRGDKSHTIHIPAQPSPNPVYATKHPVQGSSGITHHGTSHTANIPPVPSNPGHATSNRHDAHSPIHETSQSASGHTVALPIPDHAHAYIEAPPVPNRHDASILSQEHHGASNTHASHTVIHNEPTIPNAPAVHPDSFYSTVSKESHVHQLGGHSAELHSQKSPAFEPIPNYGATSHDAHPAIQSHSNIEVQPAHSVGAHSGVVVGSNTVSKKPILATTSQIKEVENSISRIKVLINNRNIPKQATQDLLNTLSELYALLHALTGSDPHLASSPSIGAGSFESVITATTTTPEPTTLSAQELLINSLLASADSKMQSSLLGYLKYMKSTVPPTTTTTTVATTTASPAAGGACPEFQALECVGIGVMSDLVGIIDYCVKHCGDNSTCPVNMCSCSCHSSLTEPEPCTTGTLFCSPRGVWARKAGMAGWCYRKCNKNSCDLSRCQCGCVAPMSWKTSWRVSGFRNRHICI